MTFRRGGPSAAEGDAMAYSRLDVDAMQKEIAPAVYGDLDLTIAPERFRTTVDTPPQAFSRGIRVETLEKFLANEEEVELYRKLTLMGDPIADAFAARVPEIGMAKARAMLDQALEEGVEAVPDAPPELVALIRDMEKIPEWLDWEKIDRFHDRLRILSAVGQEYVMRLAFMMTYTNGYAGLPMMLTGALTGPSAARRMKETTSTFRMSTLPGAMRRDGIAFKSAAKVRLMHAVVRTTLLRNPDRWDYEVYGVPIPQVDQMGAALSFNFFFALAAVKMKRPLSEFELDGIDAWRYLAYLLGMHDYFLANTRGGIIKPWSMLGATLRDKIDPRSIELNQATLHAYTRLGDGPLDKLMHALDVRNTRFLYTKVMGEEMARKLGVEAEPLDPLATVALAVPLGTAVLALEALRRVPGARKKVEAWATRRTLELLEKAGDAHYHTDVADRDGAPKRATATPSHA